MKERYLITSAVNNCEVDEKCLDSLKMFAKTQNAKLIVLPIKYNPIRLKENEILWDHKLDEYIENNNFSLNDKVTVLPEVNVRPTAIRPLTGLVSLGLTNNTIIASPRIHMETIPHIDKFNNKFIMTTGCITKPNYTKTKLGAKAKFHHTYGAVIVEIDEEDVYLRQITIDKNGGFYDLNKYYTPDDVIDDDVEAIVFGDIHELYLADVVRSKGFFDHDSMLNQYSPKYIVLHDLLDQKSRSHHSTPFTNYINYTNNVNITDEIESSIKFLDDIIMMDKGTPVIISSNHNSHLTQWLERATWQTDVSNARLITNLTLKMLDAIDSIDDSDMKVPDVYRLLLQEKFEDNIIALDYNTPLMIKDFQCGLHGDKGINGSRGLGNIHLKMNTKIISAHTHSASRIDGHLVVGTSSKLDRNYTYGLSTWSHTHAIIHKNGKAQMITQNPMTGKWCLEYIDSFNKSFEYNQTLDYINHLYQPNEEEQEKKYHVKSPVGEMYFVNSYRELSSISELTEWSARRLIETGEREGWFVLDFISS